MSLPKLSKEDRRLALEKAIAFRKERAEYKEKIRQGAYTCKEALDVASESECLKRIKVVDFIKCFSGYGDARAEKLMRGVGISDSRRLGGLGYKQASSLIIAIDMQ